MPRALVRFVSLGLLPLALCATVSADLVQTIDGKWHGLPRDTAVDPTSGYPTPDLIRQTAEARADGTFETVKLRAATFPAGTVKQIVASDEETVASFKEARAQAEGKFFADAAEMFKTAADESAGFGKQQALYFRMQATAAAGDRGAIAAAITDLLTAFPNSFYFAEAQILRAKMDSGDPAAATKALDAIKNAKNMNLRDVYRAEYWRIFLLLDRARKYDEAKKSYEDLVRQIEKGDAAQGATTRHLAQIGIGNALMRASPPQLAEALAAFQRAAAESKDPDVLGGAYLGLGNVAFGTAKQLQDDKKLPEAQEQLHAAAKHYLRVTLLYKDGMTEETAMLEALENQAKAFVALFRQSDGKDCVAAERAYKAYFELHDKLEGGEKRRINREGYEFNQERKAKGCK